VCCSCERVRFSLRMTASPMFPLLLFITRALVYSTSLLARDGSYELPPPTLASNLCPFIFDNFFLRFLLSVCLHRPVRSTLSGRFSAVGVDILGAPPSSLSRGLLSGTATSVSREPTVVVPFCRVSEFRAWGPSLHFFGSSLFFFCFFFGFTFLMRNPTGSTEGLSGRRRFTVHFVFSL